MLFNLHKNKKLFFVKMVDNAPMRGYNKNTAGEFRITASTAAGTRKRNPMDEEMNIGELLKETAEENQTRKILDILRKCKDLDEAVAKVEDLLEK